VALRGRPQAPRVVRAKFWELVRSGVSPREAGLALGARRGPERWFAVAGGVKANGPGPVSERYLSLAEREEIALGVARGESYRVVGARIGRPASTVSREVVRNGPAGWPNGRLGGLSGVLTASAIGLPGRSVLSDDEGCRKRHASEKGLPCPTFSLAPSPAR
jgi:hypothetical protein